MRLLFVLLIAQSLIACSAPIATQHPPITSLPEQMASKCDSFEAGVPIKDVNMHEVASLLRGGDYLKKEFETTAEFNQRLKPRMDKVMQTVKQQNNSDDLVWFVLIPRHKQKYNADHESMSLGEPYSGLLPTVRAQGKRAVLLSSKAVVTGSYVGENAFGVKKTIKKVKLINLSFTAHGADLLGWPDNFKPMTINMSREEAKTAKDNLVIAFVGQLRSPYLAVDESHNSPKIDDPYDEDISTEVIQTYVECAVIYNKQSKRIYDKIRFKRSSYNY